MLLTLILLVVLFYATWTRKESKPHHIKMIKSIQNQLTIVNGKLNEMSVTMNATSNKTNVALVEQANTLILFAFDRLQELDDKMSQVIITLPPDFSESAKLIWRDAVDSIKQYYTDKELELENVINNDATKSTTTDIYTTLHNYTNVLLNQSDSLVTLIKEVMEEPNFNIGDFSFAVDGFMHLIQSA